MGIIKHLSLAMGCPTGVIVSMPWGVHLLICLLCC